MALLLRQVEAALLRSAASRLDSFPMTRFQARSSDRENAASPSRRTAGYLLNAMMAITTGSVLSRSSRAGKGITGRVIGVAADPPTIDPIVAAQLGNTPAVCRKPYIHPRVLACYLDGSLRPTLAMLEASVRALEMYAVEGVVMRLLAQWHAGGADATNAADRAVSRALGENAATARPPRPARAKPGPR
jgi:DNA topoisomerase IB